ncbi:MAG: hypothetical protein EOM06_11380 [Sphingobacteriia bacterium]|nr:hypothetical protein [Sphingobacteriia bacterium]
MFLGNHQINITKIDVSGHFVEIDGEKYYQIRNYHQMPDFFISIVSDSDHWMFISSNGSLTAGRKDRDNALFPYYTVDKIHDYKGKTGSRSLFLVNKNNKKMLWEPFTSDSQMFYNITRNIYKSIYGNKIIFEEINNELGLCFRYAWYNSEKFGFVRKSTLSNLENKPANVDVLDGIINILPHGVDYNFQNEFSNLVDAYKKNEQAQGSTLGLFMLSAIPVDRAEPSESLMATTVWSAGIPKKTCILLSENQIASFIADNPITPEIDIRAGRGAYLVNFSKNIRAKNKLDWYIIAEINQSTTAAVDLNHLIRHTPDLIDLVTSDIAKGTENLKRMVSLSDGFQITNTEICYARHYTNTLFNIMRGGVFINNYQIEKTDYVLYLRQINQLIAKEFQSLTDQLPDKISYTRLLAAAEKTGNADLQRITNEYLPLTFSRRHGDPSRPWNRFSIQTKNEDGSAKFNYEGNWRDIFQNWEALSYSFPEFVEGMISKFVNSSTIDGYNPYRIMRSGIDWEAPEPDDPWAYIGYWGDHQIIYLQKLLEVSDKYHPGKIDNLLTSEIFTYANVPYRIRASEEILKNPKDTVAFNHTLNQQLKTEAEHLGADAKMLKAKTGGQLYKVNLTEKILATLLSKLSNFIPEAGIWMNTQRPEWNDANNALVGNGTSMVTLYYLRRFLKFWGDKLKKIKISKIAISEELARLLENMHSFFKENETLLQGNFSDADRLRFARHLGQAHAKFRNEIYTYAFSGEKLHVQVKDLLHFIRVSLKYTDHSIKANKRKDALYHAYNLISIKPDGISIRHLYEMLEGQVAVLSSGYLSTIENLEVLDALKKSDMFRQDQYSYMLYPDRNLPRFLKKNKIPEHLIESSVLLKKLLSDNETSIIQKDAIGEYHFNSSFRNADEMLKALDKLRIGNYSHLVETEKEIIQNIYEKVFDHQSFTGRSGTFYGYEGLGSIYWHMVSKLLLATQECFFKAVDESADETIIGRFKTHYYEIKAGIGLYKKPDIYGAFPTDAYSHTPGNAGVKQPGLTGQVKEDVISRIGELGLRITNGNILLDAALVNNEEILQKKQTFEFYTVDGKIRKIQLKKGQTGFTFCLTPFILNFDGKNEITVYYTDSSSELIPGNSINQRISSLIFSRSGKIDRVEVSLKIKKQ